MDREAPGLPIHRVSDGSVAMSDALHIVVTIEISSAFVIEEPGSFAANDFCLLVIKQHASTPIIVTPNNEPLSAPVQPPSSEERRVGNMSGSPCKSRYSE